MVPIECTKGKKVFLTGHTGFKGSWLTFWLYNLGAKVKGYSLSPINQDELYTQMNGDNICESVIGDIRDRDKLHQEIDIFQPDFVFHLAAQPLVRLSYEIPSEILKSIMISRLTLFLPLGLFVFQHL